MTELNVYDIESIKAFLLQPPEPHIVVETESRLRRFGGAVATLGAIALTVVVAYGFGKSWASREETLHELPGTIPMEPVPATESTGTPVEEPPAAPSTSIFSTPEASTVVVSTVPTEAVPSTTPTEPETTVPAPQGVETSAPQETVPPQLSLTQRLLNGETTLADNRGEPLGTLNLDKYCDTVRLYVNNPINLDIKEVIDVLSPEAQAKAALLKTGVFKGDERRRVEDDIKESGFPDGSGDPLYARSPDDTSEEGCIPAEPNPRDHRQAYGSTAADEQGGVASQYQSVGAVVEFGGIPGQGKVTVIEGHRSSQSAPFFGLAGYELGDTATYSGDGYSIRYQLVEIMKIEDEINWPEFIEEQRNKAPGVDQLFLSTCVDGEPNNRSGYRFVAVGPYRLVV